MSDIERHDSNESSSSLFTLSTTSSSGASPTNVEAPIPLNELKREDDPLNNDSNNNRKEEEGKEEEDEMAKLIANAYYPDGDERNFMHADIKEEAQTKPSLIQKFKEILYPNYILNHLDYTSFKTVSRSWCHVWSLCILTIVPLTSSWLGSAPYLTLIMGFISISGGSSIIMNTLTSLSAFAGLIIALIHHVIKSKIINDIHGGITAEQLAQSLIEEGLCQMDENLAVCVERQIFSGRYINTKAVAVTILALISTTFILGNLRKHLHPICALVYVSGMIGNCIYSCFGVFFPIYAPLELGYVAIKPMGISFAAKIVTAFLIYPSTSNWMYIQGSIKIMTGLKTAMENKTRMCKTMKPSAANFANYKAFKRDITALRSSMAPLELVASTIWLEFSYGRFDVGDIGELRSYLKNTISATASYAYFYQLLQERTFYVKDDFGKLRRRSTAASSHLDHGHAKLFSAIQDSYKKVGEYENKRRLKILRDRIAMQGATNRLTLQAIDECAKFMVDLFLPLLDSANEGVAVIIEWLSAANAFRIYAWLPRQWKKHVAKQKEMQEKVCEVKKAIEEQLRRFNDPETLQEMMVNSQKTENEKLFFISQGIFFLQIVSHQCENIIKVLDFCMDLDERRPTPILVTHFTKNKYSKPRHLSSDLDRPMPDYLVPDVQTRNADSLPPSNIFQYCGTYLSKLFRFLISNDFWFWIKAGGLITIGAIPYFVRTTAGWYYRRRMIWLVIMIAVSIGENTGSTIYVFWAKLAYTFFGAVVGMVGWYISTGNGRGNYYGYGAVTGVLFVYFVFFRHFSIHQTLLPQVLFAVTTVLVMGTSWLDAKGDLGALANVGWGFEPAYLRFIGVTIGLCIASLAAIFPKPVSSKAIVREILSKGIAEIGNIHCDVTKFAVKRTSDPGFHIETRHDVLIAKFRYLLLKVARLSTLITPLRFEVPITGFWPESKYLRLQGLITDVIQLYLMLLVAFNELDEPQEWLPIIMKRVGFCYPDLEAEIFATVYMASDALKTKGALPKITEANVSIKHMELLRKQWGINRISLSERFYSKPVAEHEGDDSESMVRELDYKRFFSKDGQLNILSLLVAHLIYNRLDEIMIVVKGLVGEIYDLDETILSDEAELLDDYDGL
ncbi:Uncharacterized protein C57A7.05 [Candida viswanathii]|uniref:Uncharacterized protein C57A7.05 n=1 Tax=Candida viswanathii TaxID=5486 RepID=A0A367XLY2_9ASCO|nr:Uncharacterized protein C57A7.05 [Candida viswanathii]